MRRARTNPLPGECVRLRPRQLLRALEGRAFAEPTVLWLDGREGPGCYPLVAAAMGRAAGGTWLYGLAVTPPPFAPTGEAASQVVHVRLETDGRGRRRYFFWCHGPGGSERAEVLYLAPGADRFRCRRCCHLFYGLYPPEPLGSYQPPWDTIYPYLEARCRELRRTAQEMLAQFPPAPATPARSTRGLDPARRRQLEQRQRAIAHLWGQSGWELEELAELFGVGVRTVQRDLAHARAAGAAPRHRVAFTPQVIAQARELLAKCAQMRKWMQATAEAMVWRQASQVRVAALQSRLLRDEVLLVAALARLGEVYPMVIPSDDPRRRRPRLTDSYLIAQARRALEQAMQEALEQSEPRSPNG